MRDEGLGFSPFPFTGTFNKPPSADRDEKCEQSAKSEGSPKLATHLYLAKFSVANAAKTEQSKSPPLISILQKISITNAAKA